MPDQTILTPEDYRNAPSGIGPLAAEWADKPHRLVYDLAREVETVRADLLRVQQERDGLLRELTEWRGYAGFLHVHGCAVPSREAVGDPT